MLRIEGLRYVVRRADATAMLLNTPKRSTGRMASGPVLIRADDSGSLLVHSDEQVHGVVG